MIVYGLKALFEEQKGNIREIRPIWALEELGQKYELVLLDPKTREHKSESFLKVNPFGKVPAIRDGDFTLFESAAICTYIGDKFGRLVPAPKTQERASYDQWISAIVSNIEPHTVRVFACDYFFDQNEKTAHIREYSVNMSNLFLGIAEGHLKQNEFMLGRDFSMADIAMTGALHFLKNTKMLEAFPSLTSYLQKNMKRPAYQKAFALNAPLA
ncbi:MAG: glutathione S-transferase family protein [Bdellovibrionia bacterium]